MHVNVSSVQDFYQCPFRWWAKWIKNRVPVAESPALDAGKLLHRVFERHFLGEMSLVDAAKAESDAYRLLIPSAHPSAQPNAYQVLTVIDDLMEAFPLWEETFPITKVLEVEEPFEYQDPELDWLVWRGRPDRRVIAMNRIWHIQNRGLAAGMNFGTYIRLQKRSYHEHLYGEEAVERYLQGKKGKKLSYGGTIFNLVRKLKFRTNVGKKNEKVKTAAEMFYQQAASYDMDGGLHAAVMFAMRKHAVNMRKVRQAWEDFEDIPAPNEKMNGGYGGNSEDPYFKVLIGEVSLDDDSIFKAREDTYATTEAE